MVCEVRYWQGHLSVGLSAGGKEILSDQHLPPGKGGDLQARYCSTGNVSIMTISKREDCSPSMRGK